MKELAAAKVMVIWPLRPGPEGTSSMPARSRPGCLRCRAFRRSILASSRISSVSVSGSHWQGSSTHHIRGRRQSEQVGAQCPGCARRGSGGAGIAAVLRLKTHGLREPCQGDRTETKGRHRRPSESPCTPPTAGRRFRYTLPVCPAEVASFGPSGAHPPRPLRAPSSRSTSASFGRYITGLGPFSMPSHNLAFGGTSAAFA